jgi:hypothetical protein
MEVSHMLTRLALPAVLAGVLLAVAQPASACPFCAAPGQTLTAEVAQADFILYGTLTNAVPDATGGFGKGTTDLKVELVIKSHDMVAGKKTLTMPRYIPPDGKETKYLVFFNVFNGQIDPYRGEAVPADSKLPDYLKGALAVREKDVVTRLKYFFDYLEDPDLVISTDAYSEFGVAEYKEVRPVAEKLSTDTLLKWLKDPNTRPTRYGLYGLLLGHCGKKEDAKAIRTLLDDPNHSFTSGLDGVLAGYILLDPQAGWDYLTTMVSDQSKEFPQRYAALKTVRFFWEYRPDVIPNARVLEAMTKLIGQSDLADLPIEDLRKWQCWELTPLVLSYANKESHNIPIVKRSILKFAVSASAHKPAAAEFVKQAREKDPKKVQLVEDLLKDEQKPVTPTTPAPGGGSSPPSSQK